MRKPLTYALLISVPLLFYFLWLLGFLPTGIQKFISNYGLHFIGTFLWTFSLIFSCVLFDKKYSKLFFAGVALAAILGSTANELLQYFEPGRVVDKWDVLAQIVGCSLAYFCYLIMEFRFKKVSLK